MSFQYLLYFISVLFASAIGDYSGGSSSGHLADLNSIDAATNDHSSLSGFIVEPDKSILQQDPPGLSKETISTPQQSKSDFIRAHSNPSKKIRIPSTQDDSMIKPNSLGDASDNKGSNYLDRIRCPFFIRNKLCCLGPRRRCFQNWCIFVDDCHECMNLLKSTCHDRYQSVCRYLSSRPM